MNIVHSGIEPLKSLCSPEKCDVFVSKIILDIFCVLQLYVSCILNFNFACGGCNQLNRRWLNFWGSRLWQELACITQFVSFYLAFRIVIWTWIVIFIFDRSLKLQCNVYSYSYWYKNGCLFPDMLTVFVAIDKCTKANGCLQVSGGLIKWKKIYFPSIIACGCNRIIL